MYIYMCMVSIYIYIYIYIDCLLTAYWLPIDRGIDESGCESIVVSASVVQESANPVLDSFIETLRGGEAFWRRKSGKAQEGINSYSAQEGTIARAIYLLYIMFFNTGIVY